MSGLADWTKGEEAIVYQACRACKHVWYFDRTFCPVCGANEPTPQRASGEGTVYGVSVVTRAATPEARAHVPYAVVLVDAAEGFRMMGHGDRDLKVGDCVQARFEMFTGKLMPYFGKG
jgi:uncharacterized OB-fold protein